MSGVFFWTPYRSSNRVGMYSRYGAPPVHPSGLPNTLVYTDAGAVMDSFIATKDPARVPAQESVLQTTIISSRSYQQDGMGLTSQSERRFPVWPHYGYWGSACCYLIDCQLAGKPANYSNTAVDGPYFFCIINRPAFFMSYILKNQSSINGADFFSGNTDPVPIWQKTRRTLSGTMKSGGYGGLYEAALHMGTAPIYAYVLRPSTQQIVGNLYVRPMDNQKGPASFSEAGQCTGLTYGSNNSGPLTPFYAYYGYGGTNDLGYYYTVSGIQDGDLIVWEFWTQTFYGVMDDTGVASMSSRIDFTVGGGTNNVTWTRDGQNNPNWAPGWGYKSTINGVETPLMSGAAAYQVSVGF